MLLAVLALLAAACGGADETEGGDASDAGGSEAAGNDAAVTLRFAWWGSDIRHEITQEAIDAFEAEHPDIAIEGEFTGWDEYWDRLATTVAGGDTPDVLQQESRYLRDYADRGVLADLSGTELSTDGLDPLVLPSGEVDGALYGVPAGVNAFTVVADPAMFEEAGVDMPDGNTWTWQDYVDAANAIAEAGGDDVFGTQDMGYNETALQIFARQRGEDLYDEQGALGFSAQTMQDWWQVSLDLQEAGGEPSASLTSELEAAGVEQSLLATGSGAMGQWWTNELNALSEMNGGELSLLRFPGESAGDQSGMFFKPSMFYSIAADTEHPEEAAMFIDFLVNETAAAEILLSDRGLPPNLDVRDEVAGALPETDQQSLDFLASIEGDLADPPPLPPNGAGEVQEILQRYNDEVLFGRMSPADATEQFMSEASAAIGAS